MKRDDLLSRILLDFSVAGRALVINIMIKLDDIKGAPPHPGFSVPVTVMVSFWNFSMSFLMLKQVSTQNFRSIGKKEIFSDFWQFQICDLSNFCPM